MTALKGSPRFTGFNRRLVEEDFISAENMQNAILNAKKANQDIVPFLIDQLKISSLDIAEKIAQEFGEPLFDLSTYDSAQIIREGIDEKLITKHRILPIFKRGNLLYVATSNPTNIDAMDAIRFNSKMNIEAIIVEHSKLEKLIEQNFAEADSFQFSDDDIDLDLEQEDLSNKDDDDNDQQQDEAPIVKYINKLLINAINMRA